MKFAQSACAALLALAATASHAELINISTTSLQSQTQSAIGCAIVGTGGASYSGRKVLVILSEGLDPVSDPVLRVRSVSGGKTYSNDDWGSSTYVDGVAAPSDASLIRTLLRAPGDSFDSGLVITAAPGVGVCAWSNERTGSGLYPASISITDVTAAALVRLSDPLREYVSTEQPENAEPSPHTVGSYLQFVVPTVD